MTKWIRLYAPASGGISAADLKIDTIEFIPPQPVPGYVGSNHWSPSGSRFCRDRSRLRCSRDLVFRDVENTRHDMFCSGLSIDANGNFVVTSGTDQRRTSIFNTTAHRWFKAAGMNIGRSYQATSTLSNGRIFSLVIHSVTKLVTTAQIWAGTMFMPAARMVSSPITPE
ncbi:hypothetical protein FQN54_005181 [Arachnomyces sp. PD_36]|nr:hypothetical protein FQN54_005181 [Arachnomyces sp. PD_36]